MKNYMNIAKIALIITVLSLNVLLSGCSNLQNQTFAKNKTSPSSGTIDSSSGSAVPASTNQTSSVISQTQFSKLVETTESTADSEEIAGKVKDYLLNRQNDKPEANKLKWSEAFLNQADIKTVYRKYLASGGKAGNIESFAVYLTKNAPVPQNWKQLFEADFSKQYDQEISRYDPLGNDLYQVYVKINGSEVPYVVVNTRTGYFHG